MNPPGNTIRFKCKSGKLIKNATDNIIPEVGRHILQIVQ